MSKTNDIKEIQKVLMEEKAKLISATTNYEAQMALDLLYDIIKCYEGDPEIKVYLKGLKETVERAMLFDTTRETVYNKICEVLLEVGQ